MTGTHINGGEPAQAGDPTYQQLAEATHDAVGDMMGNLVDSYPAMAGAVVAGTISGLVQTQIALMPGGTPASEVLAALAPQISNLAGQMVRAKAAAAGATPPREAPMAPAKRAFDALQRHLASAPVSTHVVWTKGSLGEDALVMISMQVQPHGVLTYGTVVNIMGSIDRPADVLAAHLALAFKAWSGVASGEA